MFRFAHPEYFFLLIVVPVLIGTFLYTQALKKRRLKKFGDPELLAELMPNVSYRRPVVKFFRHDCIGCFKLHDGAGHSTQPTRKSQTNIVETD